MVTVSPSRAKQAVDYDEGYQLRRTVRRTDSFSGTWSKTGGVGFMEAKTMTSTVLKVPECLR